MTPNPTAREIAATMPPGPSTCEACGGEGVIDGLVTGDRISDETCRACRGTGTTNGKATT